MNINDCKNGKYQITLQINNCNLYYLNILIDGYPIKQSPYLIYVNALNNNVMECINYEYNYSYNYCKYQLNEYWKYLSNHIQDKELINIELYCMNKIIPNYLNEFNNDELTIYCNDILYYNKIHNNLISLLIIDSKMILPIKIKLLDSKFERKMIVKCNKCNEILSKCNVPKDNNDITCIQCSKKLLPMIINLIILVYFRNIINRNMIINYIIYVSIV